VLEYVRALFDEGQYGEAAALWAKADFEGDDSVPAKYYRLLAMT
jgi:hypothetical protein